MPPSEYFPVVSCFAFSMSAAGRALVTQMCDGRFCSSQPLPFDRYTALVMTRTSLLAGGAGEAGEAGEKSSGRVELVNATRDPSGDHAGDPAPRGKSVIGRASPPSS